MQRILTHLQRSFSWLRSYQTPITVVLLWLTALAILYTSLAYIEPSVTEIALAVLGIITGGWYGWILFLGANTVRPLIFFPATIFSFAAGTFFGLGLGLLIAMCGHLISASTAYGVGRFFRYAPPSVNRSHTSLLTNLIDKRPFEVALSLHLALIPFDVVNYFAGIARLHYGSFLFGVFLGFIPGTVSMVSLGASVDIEQFLREGFSFSIFDPWYLLLSAAIFTISVIGSRLYRSYKKH